MGQLQDSYALNGTFRDPFDNAKQVNAATDQFAQNFVAAADYTAASIKLGVSRVNTPGTFTVALYAVDGDGKPTGAALASGTSNGDTLSVGLTLTWREVTFAATTSIAAGTKYAIVLSCATANATNAVSWFYAEDPSPDPGDAWQSTDGGSTWSDPAPWGPLALGFAMYDNFTPPAGGPTVKLLVAVADDAFYYEDV